MDENINFLDLDAEEPTASLQESYLAEDVVIEGNIETKGNLRFHGSLNGNVVCGGNIIISGSIHGDIKARQAMIQGKEVTGNITCEKDCDVLNNSSIQGNIEANSAIIDGTVKGNIKTADKTYLGKQATLIGDCRTKRIIMEDGAVMKGRMNTK